MKNHLTVRFETVPVRAHNVGRDRPERVPLVITFLDFAAYAAAYRRGKPA